MRRSAALSSAVVLSLGVSAAPALAQSAGDDQYQDPFANENTGGNGNGSGSTTSGTTSGSTSSGSTSSGTTSSGSTSSGTTSGTTTSTSSTTSTASTSQAAATSSGELPRTGGEPGIIALFGAGLALTGAGLRARVRFTRG